jgi:carboxymethylenebutenolidase
MSCDNCYRGYTLPGDPSGQMIDGAYLAPATDPATVRKSAVVYLTDAFGFELRNPQVMADFFAHELNMDVWVPDIFAGQSPSSLLMCGLAD